MLQDCRVYHDFPAEDFNIDHVVVGPGGVHAVETKGKAKLDRKRKDEANVIYDGDTLKFPDWQGKEYLEQAKRQAIWLQKWLHSAVSLPVWVQPVVALPGWFVEQTKKDASVTVINPKLSSSLSRPRNVHEAMSPQMIQRIAHQLEQRCRDVEPLGYRKEKEK